MTLNWLHFRPAFSTAADISGMYSCGSVDSLHSADHDSVNHSTGRMAFKFQMAVLVTNN